MTDLTNLSHDELRDHIRAGIEAAESRLSGRRLRRMKLIHALLQQEEDEAHDNGDLATRSGDDKEPELP